MLFRSGIEMMLWITLSLLPVGPAMLAIVLPKHLEGWKLILAWSAAILAGIGATFSFMGASAAILIMIPLSLFSVILALVLFLRRSWRGSEFIWLAIASVLSWSFVWAMFTYATPLAANRWALLSALIVGLGLVAARRPAPLWIVGVFLATSLLPVLLESTDVSRMNGIEKVARRIVYTNPALGDKDLTKKFNKSIDKTLRKGERFSGTITRDKDGHYNVNAVVRYSRKGYSSSNGTSFDIE